MAARSALVLSIAAALAGCTRTFQASVVQPNPLAHPTETLRESEPAVIVTGDWELERPRRDAGSWGMAPHARLQVMDRYPLRNVARFVVVSRDRLRFHVQLEHKWKEYVDLHTWYAYLVDDRGRRYEPVEVETSASAHIVEMWDREIRGVSRNRAGDIVSIKDDAHLNRQTMGSLSVFRGTGDYVFYAEGLFTPQVRSLTLVLTRSGMEFRFTWDFAEQRTVASVAEDPPPG